MQRHKGCIRSLEPQRNNSYNKETAYTTTYDSLRLRFIGRNENARAFLSSMSTPQIVLRPSYTNRRQPLLDSHSSSASSCSSSTRFAEVAGGTTAECAAVFCCCTCGLVNLLLLPIYKVPAGLCRRALRRKRLQRLMIKKDLMQPRNRRCQCGCDDTELHIHPFCETEEFQKTASKEEEKAMEELEKEMFSRFYGAGFWRSPSQREPPVHNQSPLKPM